MARFRGLVRGGRGEATRLGHTTTGLSVMAQSYSGDIRVRLYDCDDEDWAYISVHYHNGGEHQLTLYDGPIADLFNKNKHAVIVQATLKAMAPHLLVA